MAKRRANLGPSALVKRRPEVFWRLETPRRNSVWVGSENAERSFAKDHSVVFMAPAKIRR